MTKTKQPPAHQRSIVCKTGGKSGTGTCSCVVVAMVTLVLAVAILTPIFTGRESHDRQPDTHSREDKGTQLHSPVGQVSRKLLERLNTLAYNGDLTAVKALITSHSDINWNSSLAIDAHSTPIHYALHGRQDSLAQQSSSLIGQHEEVISYLVDEGHVSASHGCPVYYAIHLRNTRVLASLLQIGDKSSVACLTALDSVCLSSSVACLTALDSTGETALHSAVKSKASGFARFFSKLARKQPGHSVLDLLGLKPLKLTGPRVITLTDLNSAILPKDIELVARHLQSSVNFSTLSDLQGNTLLHTAAYGGRIDVIEILLKSGIPVNSTNLLGLTPLHLAYAGGFCGLADTLIGYGAAADARDHMGRTPGELIPYGKQLCQSQSPIEEHTIAGPGLSGNNQGDTAFSWIEQKQKYLSSGWADPARDWNLSGCDIDTLNSSLSEQDFLARYKGVYRPVRIEGLIGSWPAWEHWRKEELLKRYGDLTFTVSGVPYAELYFGANAKTAKISLAEYVTDFQKRTSGEQVLPDYIFDGQILHHHSRLSQDAPVPHLFNNFRISLKQFIVGPKHSGSPPHFHGHTFNALVYGVKLWYLWPPSEAHFAFCHVQDWQRSHQEGQLRGPAALECVQRPGDIVYVPENWGHAVVNVEDSIAVAYEFS